MKYLRSAFTLVEVAISITILVIGLTAAMSLLVVGVGWATDAKVNYTAIDAAQSIIDNPGILAKVHAQLPPTSSEDSSDPITPLTNVCSGYFNGYFFVRTIVAAVENLPDSGGTYMTVRIEGYHGGDDQLGTKVVDYHSRVFVAP